MRIGQNRWSGDFVIYRIYVSEHEIRKVEEHPPWCGMTAFKEVCLDGVPPNRVHTVPGSGIFDEATKARATQIIDAAPAAQTSEAAQRISSGGHAFSGAEEAQAQRLLAACGRGGYGRPCWD